MKTSQELAQEVADKMAELVKQVKEEKATESNDINVVSHMVTAFLKRTFDIKTIYDNL